MKYYFLSIISFFLFSSCNIMVRTDDTRAFIPGVYVGAINTEFSRGSDTLTITEFDKERTYSIARRTSFQRKEDGKLFPVEYKNEKWTAIYDEEEKVLNETAKGKVFSFNPRKKLLLLGSAEY